MKLFDFSARHKANEAGDVDHHTYNKRLMRSRSWRQERKPTQRHNFKKAGGWYYPEAARVVAMRPATRDFFKRMDYFGEAIYCAEWENVQKLPPVKRRFREGHEMAPIDPRAHWSFEEWANHIQKDNDQLTNAELYTIAEHCRRLYSQGAQGHSKPIPGQPFGFYFPFEKQSVMLTKGNTLFFAPTCDTLLLDRTFPRVKHAPIARAARCMGEWYVQILERWDGTERGPGTTTNPIPKD